MAVLVEAISVVLRIEAIRAAYAGDWSRFVADVPNATLCADGELVRVGFMTSDATREFVGRLERLGLRYMEQGAAQDMVVIDQQRGPMAPCSWVDFGHVALDRDPLKRVACCRRSGSTVTKVVCPDGWTFEQSLSSSFGFVPEGKLDRSLEFLREENGLSVYRNRLTGRDAFIADTTDETP